MNTEIQDSSSSTSLIEYKEVDNTPFTLVVSESKVSIVMGKHLVTNKTFDNVDDAKYYIAEKPWELLLIANAIYTSEVIELSKQKIESI